MVSNNLLSSSRILISLVLLFLPVLASAMTIEELVDSYTYTFNSQELNILSVSDSMHDTNSDSLNDHLTIDITTDGTATGTYIFIVTVKVPNGRVQSFSNTTISSASPSASVSFNTIDLSGESFEYLIEIRDQSYSLVFAQSNYQSNNYTSYDQGITLTGISDYSSSGSFFISLDFNATISTTENVTVFLQYDESLLSSTKSVSFSPGSNAVDIEFSDESVRPSHYDGSYTINTIKVGDKFLSTNYVTASYTYEDIVSVSHLESWSLSSSDTDSNALFDSLDLSVTVYADSSDTYDLVAHLIDEDKNVISSTALSESLAQGSHTRTLSFPGEEIYASYASGPFSISAIELSQGGSNSDAVSSAASFDGSYDAFERPPQPDVAISGFVSFASQTSTVDLTVSNTGAASAFNIFVDIFTNTSYENQSVISSLAPGESTNLQYHITGTQNNTQITALVDFDNLVDESDETNNFFFHPPQETLVAENMLLADYTFIGTDHGFSGTFTHNPTLGYLEKTGDWSGAFTTPDLSLSDYESITHEVTFEVTQRTSITKLWPFSDTTDATYVFFEYDGPDMRASHQSPASSTVSGLPAGETFTVTMFVNRSTGDMNTTVSWSSGSINLPQTPGTYHAFDTTSPVEGFTKFNIGELDGGSLRLHSWKVFSGYSTATNSSSNESNETQNPPANGALFDFTFDNSDEGFSGVNTNPITGYIEEAPHSDKLITPDIGLDSLDVFTHVLEVEITNTDNTKFGLKTDSLGTLSGHYFFDDHNGQLYWKFNGGSWPSVSVPYDETFTIAVQVDKAAGTTNSTISWSSGSASTSAQSFTDSGGDFASFEVGSGSPVKIHRWTIFANNTSSTVAPSLTASLVTPTTNQDVEKESPFTFTTNVCCQDANCGNVNVYLDPKRSEYTHFSEKHCENGVCTTTMHATPQFGFEDNRWKPIDKLRSFKETIPIACHVKEDGIHKVDCIDYNYTHKVLDVQVNNVRGLGSFVPVRKLERKFNKRKSVFEWDERLLQRKLFWFADKKEKRSLVVESAFSDELHVGPQSTTITYVPDSDFEGWKEVNGNTLAVPSWLSCDNEQLQSWEEAKLVLNDSDHVYVSGGGSSTQFSACNRFKWKINEDPSSISEISSYARFEGLPHAGADSTTKALYLGNAGSQSWTALDIQPNQWGPVDLVGSAANVQSFIEQGADNYVYTLLHYNASKASSSNNAWAKTFHTTLTIVSEDTSSQATKDGLVSTTVDDTPFYTTDANPQVISLDKDQCQDVSWNVITTGDVATTHEFFAFANVSSDESVGAETSHIDLTIVEASTNTLELHDHSGNGRHLVDETGPLSFWDPTGHFEFNEDGQLNAGADNAVWSPTANNNLSSFSVWARVDDNDGGIGSNGRKYLFGKGNSNNYEWNVYRDNITSLDGPEFRLQHHTLDGSAARTLTSSMYEVGRWYHLAGIWDGSDMVFYVDGTRIADGGIRSDFASGSAPFTLGSRSGTAPFDGALDDFRYWNIALSDNEVSSLYNNISVRCDEMEAWYPFEEELQVCSDGGIPDLVMSDHATGFHNGSVTGSVSYANGALTFAGDDDYLTIPQLSMSGDWTYSVWVKDLDNSRNSLFGDTSSNKGYLYLREHTKKILFEPTGAATHAEILYTTDLTDGTWHHVAVVFSGGSLTLYIDNSFVGSSNSTDGTDIDIDFIGHGYWAGADSGDFIGSMDDVRFFSYAMSSSEIASLYANDTYACSSLVAWYPFEEAKQDCSISPLVHHDSFESTVDGWGQVTQHSDPSDGYIEQVGNYVGFYSDDLDFAAYDAYRIEMVVQAKDSHNAKFYPNSAQYSGSDPHFYYERNGNDLYHIKYYDGSYHAVTSQAPKDADLLWVVDVDRTTACLNATLSWNGGSAQFSEKCSVNTNADYIHWDSGDVVDYIRIKDVKIYDLS